MRAVVAVAVAVAVPVTVTVTVAVTVTGCHDGRSAVELPSQDTKPIATTTPTGPWPDTERVMSVDGSFALVYPRRTFPRVSAQDDTIELVSDVSEESSYFSIKLSRLRAGIFAALRDTVDKESFHDVFPDGTEASFHASPGFFEKESGGYHVSVGVEGIGDEIHVFQTADGRAFRFDCHYCCGLVIPLPAISREEQVALCDVILHAFQRGSFR
jgi:hypothetical protein